MDLRLTPVSSTLTSSAFRAPGGVGAPRLQPGAEPQPIGFSDALKGALLSVSAAQASAGQSAREVQMDNPQVGLEETMVSIQKAQIGFQATLNVRNRMVQAYTDIMNMQV